MRTLIKGGQLVDPAQNIDAPKDVLVEGGRIEAVMTPAQSKSVKADRVVSAKGLWVVPGLIDMHVHLREPGREADETIKTGTRAAAKGGVASVLTMPNTEPVIDTPALVRFIRERSSAEGLVNVLVAGAVSRGQKGAELAEIGKMAEAGAVAASDDGRPIMNAQLMRRALEYCKGLDIPILDHCEDENLSAGGVMNEGGACTLKGVKGIPGASETVMAMRDLSLAELTGGRLHICHASCAETIELVRRAKKKGVRVSAETAPHYFTLTDEDVLDFDADFKMNPPLRAKKDLEAVREGLADGTIDAIATDHAPHAPSKKALGLVSAPFGIIGLETLLPLTLELVRQKTLSRKAAIAKLTQAPAKILGLKSKGSVKRGMDADLTLIDPDAVWTATAQGESKSRNSPFKERRMRGKAQWLMVGGRWALEAGAIKSLS